MAPSDDPDEKVQMNVRVPRWVRDQIDARRRVLADRYSVPFSRDKWVENAAIRALRSSATATDEHTGTAPPPHRRSPT